jgi:hypothetical protein
MFPITFLQFRADNTCVKRMVNLTHAFAYVFKFLN